MFSRRIVGWATAAHLRTSLPLATLPMAPPDRRPKPGALLQHTDCGSQYLSADYTARLEAAGVIPSAAGSAYDNAMVQPVGCQGSPPATVAG